MMNSATYTKYPAYKDSGVEWSGLIPEHWYAKPIRAIFQERREKNTGPVTDFILSVTKDRGVIPYDEKGAIGNNKSEDIQRYKVVYPNDLVINKMNVIIGSLGLSKYHGALSQVYIVLQPKNEEININYYAYLVSDKSFYKSMIKYCTGIMELRESLNLDEFKKLPLPIPPIDEQISIVQFLDNKTALINHAIGIKEKQIELLKERRQILIHRAVTRGLNSNEKLKESGVEWIGKIPEHWEATKLGYIAIIGNGSTPDRGSLRYWQNGEFPWLNSSKVNDKIITTAEQFITATALKECHLPILTPGTLVIAITGEGKTRGMCALCNIEATINQHLACIKVNELKIVPSFLLQYLQAMYINIRADSSGLGSTKGAITCQSIKKFNIPIPPKSEQLLIIEYIENVNNKIDTAISLKEQEIEKLKEYKASLINEAVTGKIKVS